MSDALRSLCSGAAYPQELEATLEEITARVREFCPGLRSFILGGSAATGDYVWRQRDGSVELLSDLDGLVFTDQNRIDQAGLKNALAEIEARHSSPLFQIDLAINKSEAVNHLPAQYQMVETGSTGLVLAGEDIRPAFPKHFDPRGSRAGLLLNLWKPVLYWTPPGGQWDPVYVQAAARFILDLPLLACSERGECIPGHRERARQFVASEGRDALHHPDLVAAVRWAVSARETPHGERKGLEARVARVAFQTIDALDGGGKPETNASGALVERLATWLPPRSPRRLLGEARALLRNPSHPIQDFRWWQRPKEALGGAILLGILSELNSDSNANRPAQLVRRLSEWSRSPFPCDVDTPRSVFLKAAKHAYWAGLITQYPSLKKKKDRIASFLDTG